MNVSKKSRNRDDFQDVPGYVAAMSNFFPMGALNRRHTHLRAQLVFGISGVMEVTTSGHQWLIPPQRALWIPARVEHEMRARSDVEMRTIYVREADVNRALPLYPSLVNVTPLLRELIIRATELPVETDTAGSAVQIVELILSELQFIPFGEFYMPRVSDHRLILVEKQLNENPGDTLSIDGWAELASMSSRTLARKIKDETGLSFSMWRQQIRLSEAVVRLVKGETITSIALSLGYENTGSFSRMFKRCMGISPSALIDPPPRSQTRKWGPCAAGK